MDLQSQQQPLLPRENDGMLSEDWHQYTLHSSSKNDAHENSRPATSPHQRYESLGLLLLQSGTSPSFFDPDEESCDRGSAIADEDSRGREHVPRRRARRRVRYDAPRAIACGLLALGALGALLGLVVFPPPAEGGGGATRWDATSNVLGATYSLAWTLSFYPQIVTNWRHPAAAQRGVSLDFVAWNVVGFSCYAIYTTSLKCSGVVRREYAERFGGGNGDHDTSPPGLGVATQSGYYFANIKYEISSTTIGSDSSSVSGPAAVPQVKANDVAFAWHALILTLITFAQIVWWSESDSPRDIHAEREGWVAVDQGRREPCANSVTSGVAVEDAFIGSNCNVHVATNISKHGTEYSMQQHPRRQRRKREGTTTPHISPTTKYFILLLLLLCIVLAILVACNVNIGSWGGQWLDYLYFLSFVKVGVSIVKYIPQVSHRFFLFWIALYTHLFTLSVSPY